MLILGNMLIFENVLFLENLLILGNVLILGVLLMIWDSNFYFQAKRESILDSEALESAHLKVTQLSKKVHQTSDIYKKKVFEFYKILEIKILKVEKMSERRRNLEKAKPRRMRACKFVFHTK